MERTRISIPILLLSCAFLHAADPAVPTAEQLAFFESKIRPVLAEKCYKCHSDRAEKIRGGLLLDTREGIRRGGDNGPAVVPGDLDASLLIDAVRHTNRDTAMPPEKAGGKLPDSVIRDLQQWVRSGAADPRDGSSKVVKKFDADAARRWWAFQPVVRPPVPLPVDTAWARNDIDRFVRAAQEKAGVSPAPDAERATLLRRVHFDLTGLPPSPAQLAAFLADSSPNALATVVDRLLASPQFGERWGRHWLDVARFAESTGKDINTTFPHAWRYRDYVIDSFNADKPFDQFLREQIAGDLLPPKNPRHRAELLTATGFLALGPKGLNEPNPRQFHLDLADEQIDTVSQSFLALTLACARCHDHKFDPVPQRDYYALAGIFLSTETCYGTPRSIQNRHPAPLLDLPPDAATQTVAEPISRSERERFAKEAADARKELADLARERFTAIRENSGVEKPPEQRQQIRFLGLVNRLGAAESALANYDASGTPRPLAMGVRDLPVSASQRTPPAFSNGVGTGLLLQRLGGRPPEFALIGDSPLFSRGEVGKPGEKIPRAFPAILNAGNSPIPEGVSGRLQLAAALTSVDNPLTSRVLANRVWHWIFGTGLVGSPDNFGTTGQKPSNQELLDHLACQLRDEGWSLKGLLRSLLLSHTYSLASTHNPSNFTRDPENRLLWRHSPKPLEAEALRDAMLAISGMLDPSPPLGSAIATEGDGPLGLRRRDTESRIASVGGTHRSVYLPIPRDQLPDVLAVFDFAEPSLVTGARENTNVPSQALYLLNNAHVAELATKTATRILTTFPDNSLSDPAARLDQRLRLAFQLAFSRNPEPVENQAAMRFFTDFATRWRAEHPRDSTASQITTAAWTSFARALFATAEFRSLN